MRVLVVDDERHIVRLVQANLQRQDHAVTCAYDEAEAVRLLGQETFDFAVIDGEMTGLLAWIRENEGKSAMRVLVLEKKRQDGDPPGPTAGANLWPVDLPRVFES